MALLEKIGKVTSSNYLNWIAELTGDADNTGGFYLVLLSPNMDKENILFWQPSLENLLNEIHNLQITIQWN